MTGIADDGSLLPSDWKVGPRIRDAGLMKRLHQRGGRCVLCGNPGSLHHLLSRSQGGDDVEANLVWLCGDGVTGCHGKIEAADSETLAELGAYVREERPDFEDYLGDKLWQEGAQAWLNRKLPV